MEKNDQNRNFTLSTKVTASQKAKFMQEAERLKLSLSEWMCGTLEMSINAYKEVDKSEMILQLQEDNDEKEKIIKSLSSRLELNKLYLDIKNEKVFQQDKTIMNLKDLIQKLQRKLDYFRNSD